MRRKCYSNGRVRIFSGPNARQNQRPPYRDKAEFALTGKHTVRETVIEGKKLLLAWIDKAKPSLHLR
jgi:hypothetical protein